MGSWRGRGKYPPLNKSYRKHSETRIKMHCSLGSKLSVEYTVYTLLWRSFLLKHWTE